MDRNREARRAAAMSNTLHRRRHRTAGSLRESPEDDGGVELQETGRLRDRTVKKDRDREMRDRMISRNKRRRGVDKYMHGGEDGGGGGGDESSDESVNDEDEEDDNGGPVRYPPPLISSATTSTLTHRKSFPPPTKIYRSAPVAPTWKAADEMIGVPVPRKARSASTKRSHDCWTSSGDVILRQASPSPVRSTMTASPAAPSPSSSQAPMSPSSSNVSVKKKLKPNAPKQKPPLKSCPKSSQSIQEEIEIEVAEVLYDLRRQSQPPSSSKHEPVLNDLTKVDRSTGDSKSRASSPSSSHAPPLTVVAPKRKRPRPYPEENPANRGNVISLVVKSELDQTPKTEVSTPMPLGSTVEIGDLTRHNDPGTTSEAGKVATNGLVTDPKPMVDESDCKDLSGRGGTKMEETSSSTKLESLVHNNRGESTSTSNKGNQVVMETNHREEKFEIDLMAPPPASARGSPEEEAATTAEYRRGGGKAMRDDKPMVTDKEAEAKGNERGGSGNEDVLKCSSSNRGVGVEFNVNTAGGVIESDNSNSNKPKAKAVVSGGGVSDGEPHKHPPSPQLNLNTNERDVDLPFDLEKVDPPTTTTTAPNHLHHHQKLNSPPSQPKTSKDDLNEHNKAGQSSSVAFPMSVAAAGWHGGLPPMGYVAPLQGMVSMDGSAMTSAPIQPPHFMFSQPRPKRCATHCCIARSISLHQQVMKINPFWPAAAPGSAPLFGAKPYNLNMVPTPPDLQSAAGRAGVVNPAQDKTQPFAFFPGQSAATAASAAPKDKSMQVPNAPPDSGHKKQLLLPQSLPPGSATNVMHAPTFFFPYGQQQASAAVSARPAATPKSQVPPSSVVIAAASAAGSTPASSSASMGAASVSAATPQPAAGPPMSFAYPNMGGSEAQFMAILGNSPYPFPIPAHVGAAATPYRGSHPQAMSFFNGPFYSSQMLHPSQLQHQQQQQQQVTAMSSQPMQIQQQQQSHTTNPSISTASSSSQKHMQNQQQQRPQGSGASAPGNSTSNLQNFQLMKGRTTQPQHDVGAEDSPTADSRTRPNMGVYGQNFALPFHPSNFGLMTPPPSTGGVPNGDKKQQQQQSSQHTSPFPMSFSSNMKVGSAAGFDISSMAQSQAVLQSLPEASRHNCQVYAAAVQAAQPAANQKKGNYQQQDSKSCAGNLTNTSNADEEMKTMVSRAGSAPVGQSIAFSRDLGESNTMTITGNNVVDTSARNFNIPQASVRSNRSPGPNPPVTNSSALISQQQQQMLFTKQQQQQQQQQFVGRSKTTPTSNGNVYTDPLASSAVMAAKFPNAIPSFPPFVNSSSVGSSQAAQWKSSGRPNTSSSQMTSPPVVSTSTASNLKNHHPQQQQSRPQTPQQNHSQISFGAPPASSNPKPSTTSQGGQSTPNANQAPSSPMVGSPSTSSISKNAGGSPRMATSSTSGNKTGSTHSSTLSAQQPKSSPSPSLSNQKPSILGSPHMISTTSSSASKSQLQDSQQQQPQLSKQSIQQAQLFFSSNAYMQQSPVNTSGGGGGYYLQRHRPENQQQQQQHHHQGSKSQQGSGPPPSSSSGVLSLCTSVSMANASTSDPAKAVAAATSNVKGGGGLPHPPQGMFHVTQYGTAQSAGGPHQLVPAGFPYVHAVPTAVQVKPTEQKKPAA